MKNLFTYLLFTFLLHSVFGQACGIYRIRYIGPITSEKGTVYSLELPTTLYLSGLEKVDSESAFVETKPYGEEFELDIKSHLGKPYSNAESLLAFYKSQSPTFKMKVWLQPDEGEREELILDIDWNQIEVTFLNYDGLGPMFEFRFQKIVI